MPVWSLSHAFAFLELLQRELITRNLLSKGTSWKNYKHLLIDVTALLVAPVVCFPVIAFEVAFIRHMQAIAYMTDVLHQHFPEEKQVNVARWGISNQQMCNYSCYYRAESHKCLIYIQRSVNILITELKMCLGTLGNAFYPWNICLWVSHCGNSSWGEQRIPKQVTFSLFYSCTKLCFHWKNRDGVKSNKVHQQKWKIRNEKNLHCWCFLWSWLYFLLLEIKGMWKWVKRCKIVWLFGSDPAEDVSRERFLLCFKTWKDPKLMVRRSEIWWVQSMW